MRTLGHAQIFYTWPCTLHMHRMHSVPLTNVYITIIITCALYAFQMESLLCKLKSKPKPTELKSWWALMANYRPDWSSDSMQCNAIQCSNVNLCFFCIGALVGYNGQLSSWSECARTQLTMQNKSFVGQTRFLFGFTLSDSPTDFIGWARQRQGSCLVSLNLHSSPSDRAP